MKLRLLSAVILSAAFTGSFAAQRLSAPVTIAPVDVAEPPIVSPRLIRLPKDRVHLDVGPQKSSAKPAPAHRSKTVKKPLGTKLHGKKAKRRPPARRHR